MHHLRGEGDFDTLLGPRALAGDCRTRRRSPRSQALVVGLLLLVAAAGKSALVPFSGWLPRAMEGPTPSSAVFYGALSVHLGAFLLLRVSPLLERSLWLCAGVVRGGAGDGPASRYLAGSVQTDIKSALSFASLSQVGLIVAEIGLGLRYIALIHLLGHACLRTFSSCGRRRSCTITTRWRTRSASICRRPGRRWDATRHAAPRLALPAGAGAGLPRRLAAGLRRRSVRPVLPRCDALERRWTDFLSGEASRESDQVTPAHRDDRRAHMNPLNCPGWSWRSRIGLVGCVRSSADSATRPRRPLGLALHRHCRSPSRSWPGSPSTSALDAGADPALEPAAVSSSARSLLELDELNAPLVPAVALLHFLTALATPRTNMRRFSFSWSLATEAIRLAMFSCPAIPGC